MEEKIFAEKPEEKISITAEEVTDIRLTQAGYYWEAGYNEFDFTCRIEGRKTGFTWYSRDMMKDMVL